MTRSVIITQMKEHARCLSLPQLVEAISNLGAGTLPLAENVVRAVLFTAYTEREGEKAAARLRTRLQQRQATASA